ncbi:MAG: ubiquinone/menaquinone biosynthesis methyltransferase [Candidatus Cloacimonetes bacterium]|nr:ubiquinone/menaquinone biosynthesis methyltransferase [Candidatus Cloacimonadota bacterium]
MNNKQTDFVKKVFSEVPTTYERTNHVLTLGFDTIWRKKTAKIAASHGGTEWVDMCTGTGEMAAYLSRLAPQGTNVSAVDLSSEMMAEASKKLEAENIKFFEADVKDLPFEDGSIDLITISFATRNINLNKKALVKSFSEFRRVLKQGGRFVNLETSQPPSYMIRKLFHLFVKLFVKQVGSRISGSINGYLYLSKTIPKFYTAKELADIMYQAGFQHITFKRLLFGVAAIHQGTKL